MKLFFVEQIFLIFALSFSLSSGLNSYISIGRCNEWEQEEFEREHLICTRQVEERYSLILERFEVDIPSPHGSARSNQTKPIKKTQDVNEICNMLHDSITKCGQIYKHCLTEEEFRHFQDGQIEIFVQLLTTLYSLGPEVSQCEIVQEYERSGRKDVVRPTDKCKEPEVKKLTIKYQQCMEDANYDMSSAMIGHQADFDLAFDALCLGIDRVVHQCSDILFDCYTVEEIEETKLGQLELMRKVFLDLVENTSPNDKLNNTEGVHWDFDIKKCHAYYRANANANANSAISNFVSSFNVFGLTSVLALTISLLYS